MAGGDPEEAAAAWRRVVAWCTQRAPVTAASLHGPADDATLVAVQDELGQEWPDDLVAWLLVSDGADRSHTTALIPGGFIPAPVERIRHDWHMLTGIARDVAREYGTTDDLAEMDTAPAGAPAFLFLPSFVPIADDTSGDLLFVDLRDGKDHGRVGHWDHEDGYHGADHDYMSWIGVSHLARTVADALENGRWAPDGRKQNDQIPVISNGVLHWEDPADDEILTWGDGDVPAAPINPDALRNEFLLNGGKRRTDTEMALRLGVPVSAIAAIRRQIEAERHW